MECEYLAAGVAREPLPASGCHSEHCLIAYILDALESSRGPRTPVLLHVP